MADKKNRKEYEKRAKKAASSLGGISGMGAKLFGGRGRQLDKMEAQLMGESEKKKKKK